MAYFYIPLGPRIGTRARNPMAPHFRRDFPALEALPSRQYDWPAAAIRAGDPPHFRHVLAAENPYLARKIDSLLVPTRIITMDELEEAACRYHHQLTSALWDVTPNGEHLPGWGPDAASWDSLGLGGERFFGIAGQDPWRAMPMSQSQFSILHTMILQSHGALWRSQSETRHQITALQDNVGLLTRRLDEVTRRVNILHALIKNEHELLFEVKSRLFPSQPEMDRMQELRADAQRLQERMNELNNRRQV